TDQLTGLPNARSLQIQFEKEVGRAKRAGNSVQILMLDLDGFKAVNDTFGHQAGDKMLTEVGRIIKGELRDYDFLARYGGDEFVAIVPETDRADVIELCSRIESAVAAYAATVNGAIVPVGVSVGSASYPSQGESFEELLIAADKAMYRAKAFHKERIARMDNVVDLRVIDEINSPPAEVRDSSLYLQSAGDDTSRDNGLVVELDESHILTVNTIN
ncbi:MAG: GGDEF domain-containing protein, partial [Acidobacteriota bacterium]